MSAPASTVILATKRKFSYHYSLSLILWAGLLLLFIFGLLGGPMGENGIHKARESSAMQQTRSINLLLFSYAQDYDQLYATGKSSTEVFQKLLDESYATDPSIFYLPLPGKVKPAKEQKLKPENVSFDITSGITGSSPNQIPVVFETGYKITYEPGSPAMLLPGSSFSIPYSWKQWWNDRKPLSAQDGIAVAYKSNTAKFWPLRSDSNSGGSVPNFISPEFKPDGKTYRQLTPEGELTDGK